MAEDVDYVFHAERLLENPAYRRAIEDERNAIVREMHRLDVWQKDERWAASVALSTLENLDRRWRKMATAGRIEQFNAKMARSVA